MCDTFIALPQATEDGTVVFGKNSDRPKGEAQSVRGYKGGRHGAVSRLACTHMEIPQARKTFDVVLSQPDWMWGAEMGANSQGVVIGNEAVWTAEPLGPPALLGMDLVRLGLERGGTAENALNTITALLEEFGQGGPCAENDPSFSYHNSFLLADAGGAWVLETAGRWWVAEKVRAPVRNISNGLTIRTGYDRCAPGLEEMARERGWPLQDGRVDFAGAFGEGDGEPDASSRRACGARLMERRLGKITPEIMMEILADHDGGICMHGAFETTASMVSRLSKTATHWMTGASHPCQTPFREVDLP